MTVSTISAVSTVSTNTLSLYLRGESTSTGSRPTGLAVAAKVKDDDGWETVPKKGGGGKGGGDGWNQVRFCALCNGCFFGGGVGGRVWEC